MKFKVESGPPSAARVFSDLSLTGSARSSTFKAAAPAVVILGVSVLAGGGRGGAGDLAVQLLSLVLLGHLLWLGANGNISWASSKWVLFIPALAWILPIVQLMPIPPTWWGMGTARTQLTSHLAAVGVTPVFIASLNPAATERTLWSLLPATSLFFATLALAPKSRNVLVATILVLALLNVILGMAQLADGPESSLRFYAPTNPTEAVGVFANRNHLASLLAMALPLALAWTGWVATQQISLHKSPALMIFGAIGAVSLLVLGIALARSRTGILLGMLAVLGALPMVFALRRSRGALRVAILSAGIVLMLCVQFALFGILERIGTDPLDDARWEYAHITKQAAEAYMPLGSGLGTFRQAFQPFEATRTPGHSIVNHAHNDYLELWLEGGIPALILLGIAGIAWGWRGVGLFRRNIDVEVSDSMTLIFARAAWLAASLALIHSALDYPLRTTANLAVFGVLVAMAFSEPANRRQKRRSDGPTPHP